MLWCVVTPILAVRVHCPLRFSVVVQSTPLEVELYQLSLNLRQDTLKTLHNRRHGSSTTHTFSVLFQYKIKVSIPQPMMWVRHDPYHLHRHQGVYSLSDDVGPSRPIFSNRVYCLNVWVLHDPYRRECYNEISILIN